MNPVLLAPDGLQWNSQMLTCLQKKTADQGDTWLPISGLLDKNLGMRPLLRKEYCSYLASHPYPSCWMDWGRGSKNSKAMNNTNTVSYTAQLQGRAKACHAPAVITMIIHSIPKFHGSERLHKRPLRSSSQLGDRAGLLKATSALIGAKTAVHNWTRR